MATASVEVTAAPSRLLSSTSSSSLLGVHRPKLEKTGRISDFSRSQGPLAPLPEEVLVTLSAPAETSSLADESRVLQLLDVTLASAALPKGVSNSLVELICNNRSYRTQPVWGEKVPHFNKTLPRIYLGSSNEAFRFQLHLLSPQPDRPESLLIAYGSVPRDSFQTGEKNQLRVNLELMAAGKRKEKDTRRVRSIFAESSNSASILIDYRLTEVCVLPAVSYVPLLRCILDGNFEILGLLDEMLLEIPLPSLTAPVLTVLHESKQIDKFIDTWLQRSLSSAEPETLFRSDTLGTRIFEQYLNQMGRSYLHRTLRPIAQRILEERRRVELIAAKLETTDNLRQNLEGCLAYLTEITTAIFNSASAAPSPFCSLIQRLYTATSERFPTKINIGITAVNSFLFLRFFVPALMAPTHHGLLAGELPVQTAGTFNTLARVLQKVANFAVFDASREANLHLTNQFVETAHQQLLVFVNALLDRQIGSASPAPDAPLRAEAGDSSYALVQLSEAISEHQDWWEAKRPQRPQEIGRLLTTVQHLAVLHRKVSAELLLDSEFASPLTERRSSLDAQAVESEDTIVEEWRRDPRRLVFFRRHLASMAPYLNGLDFLIHADVLPLIPHPARKEQEMNLAVQFLVPDAKQRLALDTDTRNEALTAIGFGKLHIFNEVEQRMRVLLTTEWSRFSEEYEASLPSLKDDDLKDKWGPKRLQATLKHEVPDLVKPLAVFFGLQAPRTHLSKLKKASLLEALFAPSQRSTLIDLTLQLVASVGDRVLFSEILSLMRHVPETLASFSDRFFVAQLRGVSDEDLHLLSARHHPISLFLAAYIRTFCPDLISGTVGKELSDLFAPTSWLMSTPSFPPLVPAEQEKRTLTIATSVLNSLIAKLSSSATTPLSSLLSAWMVPLRSHFFRLEEDALAQLLIKWLLSLLAEAIFLPHLHLPTPLVGQGTSLGAVLLARVSSLLTSLPNPEEQGGPNGRLLRMLRQQFAKKLLSAVRTIMSSKLPLAEALPPPPAEAKPDYLILAHYLYASLDLVHRGTDTKTFSLINEAVDGKATAEKTYNFLSLDVSSWSIQDVADWVDYLHLGECVSSFKDGEVDGRTLLTMTIADLQQIGVTKLGHQKRLLSAVRDHKPVVAAQDGSESSSDPLPSDLTAWSVDDVCSWLGTLDLSEVVPIITKERVNGAKLLQLTDEVLQRIGVAKLGHRKRILAARSAHNAEEKSQGKEKRSSHPRQSSTSSVPSAKGSGLRPGTKSSTSSPAPSKKLSASTPSLGASGPVTTNPMSMSVQPVTVLSRKESRSSGLKGDDSLTASSSSGDRQLAEWSVVDVIDWAEGNGLAELIPLLKANHVSGSKLMRLSDAELQQLGVEKLGHRKRLLGLKTKISLH